jgi:N-acetylmuramoyl-L-alanine amidase
LAILRYAKQFDAKKEIPYSYRLLNKDPSIQKPQRLYVDLKNTRVGPKLSTIVPIRDNLLKGARAGQHTRSSVRVVLDIKTIDTFKVFSLYNPFRIVIDINGKGTITDQDGSPGIPHPQALARQLALNVNRIVIDPGHGGKDPGAPGCYKGVVEKDIVLQVSKKLGKKIEAELGFVSHDKECKRLTMSKYQDQLVNGIVDGIRRYIKKIKAPVI